MSWIDTFRVLARRKTNLSPKIQRTGYKDPNRPRRVKKKPSPNPESWVQTQRALLERVPLGTTYNRPIRRVESISFLLTSFPLPTASFRLGMIATVDNLGKLAVYRNRAKRRLFHAAKAVILNHVPKGHAFVFLVKHPSILLAYPDLIHEVCCAVRKLNLFVHSSGTLTEKEGAKLLRPHQHLSMKIMSEKLKSSQFLKDSEEQFALILFSLQCRYPGYRNRMSKSLRIILDAMKNNPDAKKMIQKQVSDHILIQRYNRKLKEMLLPHILPVPIRMFMSNLLGNPLGLIFRVLLSIQRLL